MLLTQHLPFAIFPNQLRSIGDRRAGCIERAVLVLINQNPGCMSIQYSYNIHRIWHGNRLRLIGGLTADKNCCYDHGFVRKYLATASARQRTCSFLRMCSKWMRTVMALMVAFCAISLLESPSASRIRISASRVVKPFASGTAEGARKDCTTMRAISLVIGAARAHFRDGLDAVPEWLQKAIGQQGAPEYRRTDNGRSSSKYSRWTRHWPFLKNVCGCSEIMTSPMDGDHACAGDELNGFAGVRHLTGCWRRRSIPQELGIVQGGRLPGVALKNFLKLFEGIIKLFLFV